MSRKPEQLLELEGFVDAFQRESDRAAAILARALMEELLGQLFAAIVVTGTDRRALLDQNGPLGTLSARIRLALCLGLISKEEGRDLNQIREIGNAFAHGLDHKMSFEESPIRERVTALQLPKWAGEWLKPGARTRFQVTVAILWTTLQKRAERGIRAEEPPTFIYEPHFVTRWLTAPERPLNLAAHTEGGE